MSLSFWILWFTLDVLTIFSFCNFAYVETGNDKFARWDSWKKSFYVRRTPKIKTAIASCIVTFMVSCCVDHEGFNPPLPMMFTVLTVIFGMIIVFTSVYIVHSVPSYDDYTKLHEDEIHDIEKQNKILEEIYEESCARKDEIPVSTKYTEKDYQIHCVRVYSAESAAMTFVFCVAHAVLLYGYQIKCCM